MKLSALLYRATQDGQVMVESSDKMWSTGEGNGKPLQHSCLENPMNSMKRLLPFRTLKGGLPRSVGTQYATGDQWRNNSRKNEAAAAAKSLQLVWLCDPIDGSPPGSSVPGILQAGILEWVAISFSSACMHAKLLQSCPTLCDPMDSSPPGSSVYGILYARILEWVSMSFSERMKRWSQSENSTWWWMWLVMEVKSNAMNNSVA